MAEPSERRRRLLEMELSEGNPSERRRSLLEMELGATPAAPPQPDIQEYLPAREPSVGRAGQTYASETPFNANVEGYKAWGDVYDHLRSTGLPEDVAAAEATRQTAGLQVLGHVDTEGRAAEALDAYKGELTAGKAATQIVNQVIPLTPPTGDADWRERAAKFSSLGPMAAWDELMLKLEGEPMSAADAKAAGLDKPLVQEIKDAAGDVFDANLYTMASGGIAPTLGSLGIADLPGWGDVLGASSRGLATAGKYASDPDVQAAVAPEALTRLGQRALINTPLPDAIPVAIDAIVDEDTQRRVRERSGGKSAGDLFRDELDKMRRSDAFDPAAKLYYTTGNDAALADLTLAQVPSHIPVTKPDIGALRAAISAGGVAADRDEFADLRELVADAADDAALETAAEQIPLGALSMVQPGVGPTRDDVVKAYTDRVKAQTATGGKETDEVVKALGAAMMRPDVVNGERVFMPSEAQKWMSLLNTAQSALVEVDLPVAPLTWAGAAMEAAGSDVVGPMLSNLRVPTPAGWETMVATGAYDPLLHEMGYLGSQAERQRDGNASYLGRVLANAALPEYQTLGLQKGARAQGVKPGSTADLMAGGVDIGADILLPWEEIFLGPAATVVGGSRKAWIAAREANRAGQSAEQAARTAMKAALPRLFGGAVDSTEAMNAALMAGFHDDIRAGRRVFGSNDAPGTMNWKMKREVAQQLRDAGFDADAVMKQADDVADEYARMNGKTVKEWMARGAPQDIALRSSPEYAAYKAQMQTVPQFTPELVDAALALNEQRAWQAVADGKVATPQEWFAMQRVEAGGSPGVGAYFQVGDDYAAGVADYLRRRDELYAQGMDGPSAGAILGDDIPRLASKRTPYQQGMYDAHNGKVGRKQSTRSRGNRADVTPVEPEPQSPERVAVQDAEAAWSRALRDVVAAGGDPWAPDAAIKHPELFEAGLVMEDAKRRLRATQAYSSRTGPTIHGSIEPDQAKWLIRYFKTADAHTLLHENAHLIRFVLGDKWMDELAQFFDHTTVNGQKVLTRNGEEQFADALARVMRGELLPNGRVNAYMGELKDTIGDLWLKLRGKPVVLPPGFRQWWDVKTDPTKKLRTLAQITDVRQGRDPLSVRVKVDPNTKLPDLVELAEKEPNKRAGQVRDWMGVHLTPGQTQKAFGLTAKQTEADALDAAARAVALVGTTLARRTWGFEGDVVRIGRRSAVPAARKAKVLERVRAALESAIGGPIPKSLTFDPKAAQGLADHVADLADRGLAEQLPRSVLDPQRDFSTVTQAEWRAIADATADDLAGPGAFRDRRAEAVAGNLAMALIRGATAALSDAPTYEKMRKGLADKFDATFDVARNLNPAAAEKVEEWRRDMGDIATKVVRARAMVKAGAPTAEVEEIIRGIAAQIPRLGVAPSEVDDLFRLRDALADSAQAGDFVTAADEVGRMFNTSPAKDWQQRQAEREAVRLLRNAKRTGTMPPAGELADAAGIVQAGLHRRTKAVVQTGLRIVQSMQGVAELKGMVEAPEIVTREMYKAWYDGDFLRASDVLNKRGGASDPMSGYDPLAAALAVTTTLMADGVMARIANDMMSIGLPINSDAVTFAGRNFSEWVPLSSPGLSREEYREAVLQYMNAILSFKGSDRTLWTDEADPKFVRREQLPEQLVGGQVNVSAWNDAHRLLSAWGAKDGTMQMQRYVLPSGEEVFIPDVVVSELDALRERTAKAGLAWTQAAEGKADQMLGRPSPSTKTGYRGQGTTADWLNSVLRTAIGGYDLTLGMARVGVTTGLLLPNPAFYIGNMFGGAVQLYQAKGATGTLRALGRYLSAGDGGAVLRSVYARMWGDAHGYYKPASASLIDASGRVLSDEYLTQEAIKAGLHTSMPKAESAIKIIEDIRNNAGTFWTRIKRDGLWGGVKEGARYWQGLLTDASAAVDDLFRVAAFVDEMKGGATSAEAAAIARRAAFDYGDLTDFEKEVMRRTVMFYTYQRRNADLFWWTLLNNPSRVMGQFRAVRDAQELAFGDDNTAKMVMPDYLDGRIILGLNKAVGDEQGVKGTMGIATLLPPIPVADHFALWVDIFRTLNGSDTGQRELLSRLTPNVQFPIVMATGMDIFSGRDLAAYNTVPSWFVEMDRQMNGGVVVDDIFKVRRTQNRDPSSDVVPGEDRWEPTGAGAKWWWVFRNLVQVPPFGRSMDTITQMGRADWLLNGAVNGARWYRQASGLTGAFRDEVADPLFEGLVRPLIGAESAAYYEPQTMADDLVGPRTGFTTQQEARQLLGVKGVAIPTKELALDKAEADRLRRAKALTSEEKKRDPERYAR